MKLFEIMDVTPGKSWYTFIEIQNPSDRSVTVRNVKQSNSVQEALVHIAKLLNKYDRSYRGVTVDDLMQSKNFGADVANEHGYEYLGADEVVIAMSPNKPTEGNSGGFPDA